MQSLTQLENRCNRVKRAFPGVGFRIVHKVPQECEQYINDVCKLYGFKHRLNPLAFTNEGHLIGGYQDMVKELEARFQCNKVPLDPEDLVSPEVSSKPDSQAELTDRNSKLQEQTQTGESP